MRRAHTAGHSASTWQAAAAFMAKPHQTKSFGASQEVIKMALLFNG
jgi:hypothetical protein